MDLQGVNLQGADLSGAKLSLTNLSEADLKNATLRGAVLGGADFAGADLRGADLTDAQLAGAYLKEALLDQEVSSAEPYEPEKLPRTLPEEMPEDKSNIGEKGTVPEPSSQPSVQEEIISEPVQEVGEKKKAVTLPDIKGRAEATLRSKELIPIAEAQVTGPGQSDDLSDAARAKKKSSGLDDIPVIDTGPDQDKKDRDEVEETELSLWDTFASLFGSDTGKKKTAEKAPAESAVAKKERADQQEQLHQPARRQEVSAIPEHAFPQTRSESDRQEPGGEQQVYSVETFAQSRVRMQTLIEKLHKEKRCVACDLSGADLTDEDLEEADLERADLSGARLEDADLRGANLKGVNFTDANLKNADLRKADLYRADFTDADLTGARLEGALLDSTEFGGAVGAKQEAAHE